MCACVKVAKDEKDGDVRRLLRRVTNRSKSTRRQRSKSAHGHLQSMPNERNIDDAVAKAAAAEKHKLSNDELHTTSSQDLDKQKGFALLAKLQDVLKDRVSKDEPPSSSRHVKGQQAEMVQRSPTLRNQAVSTGLERARSRNARQLAMVHPAKSPSHRSITSLEATIPRSYCGIGSHSESVLLFPGHSRDILLRQSRDRVASAGSNSSGFHSLSTGRFALPEERRSVDSLSAAKSASAYLGSRADGHSPVMRRAVMRNRAANALKCWQRPESNLTAEQVNMPGVTGEDNRLSSSVSQEETLDLVSKGAESPTKNVSPSHLGPRLPYLEFKKANHLHDISPLSLSVQCGSDSDNLDHIHETAVIPTHRLTSKRVWNVNTCSWEDTAEYCFTDSLCSSHQTPDSCNVSDLTFPSMSRDTGKIVFTRADSDVKSFEPVYSKNTFQFANSQRNQCFYSENDIQNAESHLRKHKNDATLRQPAVTNGNVGACNKDDHILTTRHSVIGGSCDEKVVSNWREEIIKSFHRAKSCPEMTMFSYSIFLSHSVNTGHHVRHRRKVSRFVSNVRQTVPKGSERRRRVSRVRVIRPHNLSPPLFASWPGKGDIKGSMLAYESSV